MNVSICDYQQNVVFFRSVLMLDAVVKECLEHVVKVRGTREKDCTKLLFIHFHDSVNRGNFRILWVTIQSENPLRSTLVMFVILILWSCSETVDWILLVRVVWFKDFVDALHALLILIECIWVIWVDIVE